MVEKVTDIKLEVLSLYRADYLAQYYVREIAKLLKKNHATLLPHLSSLEKDKILVSKLKGKNKLYSLNLDNNIAKNWIIIAEQYTTINYLEKNFLIKKITKEIFNLNLQGTLILFGSYAKKTFNEQSDIDLFYIGNLKQSQIKEIKKIEEIYGKKINIKQATKQTFSEGLWKKSGLINEVVKKNINLQNAEVFVNALWRYYEEVKQ